MLLQIPSLGQICWNVVVLSEDDGDWTCKISPWIEVAPVEILQYSSQKSGIGGKERMSEFAYLGVSCLSLFIEVGAIRGKSYEGVIPML